MRSKLLFIVLVSIFSTANATVRENIKQQSVVTSDNGSAAVVKKPVKAVKR